MTSPRPVHPEAAARARSVRLVLFDVDGVLTDGRIIVLADGNEARAFHSRDGLGIRLGQSAGLRFGVVSGRRTAIVERRARELDFVAVRQGVADKGECVREISGGLGVALHEVCFVGDDVVDLPAMRLAGLAAAPADADPTVLDQAHLVAGSGGGRGAVREIVDFILRSQERWDEAARRYLGGKG